jgi:RNase adaptor protein for sRNA GlmZ degradation
VFDCRCLPNPGREPQYRSFSGKDACVKEYLEKYEEVDRFKQQVHSIIDMAVDNYIEREFNHLMVSFGCTGGQHRSAYFAECAAAHLRAKYPDILVELRHRDCPC